MKTVKYGGSQPLLQGSGPWSEQEIAAALFECGQKGFSDATCRKAVASEQEKAKTPKKDHAMTRTDFQRALCARAEQFARARHYQGQGRFEMVDYRSALAERSPQDKAAERGLAPAKTRSDRGLAGRRFVEAVKMFQRDHGLPHKEAVTAAKVSEGNTLKSLRAGFAPRPKTTQGAQVLGRFFKP